ncbi:hypothetical protein MUS1_11155 [Marinomonas ushuaiensis DSM 15871]|uniref:Uncharacterized protein n=1 Tax=Marinomonas ushuaiensis DSM 15871 TaxID=1122207 RepID=X7E658_9GAMM|nr:hypothetical protein [Marinomonas ushuaiensis]ETX11407.1 hypothetical protein MUS1_11155 [Marinomonas ushuaiensis DSM 15871]
MKKIIGILLLATSFSVIAVDGYKDIYIDKDKDIIIHGMLCGDDLNDLSQFQPSSVYTNTPDVEKGTYYFKSPYGEFSLTFNTTANELIMVRGLLQNGQTSKDDMVKKLCIVKYAEGLPPGVAKYVQQKVIKAGDKDLELYEAVSGSPAIGKGQY